MPRDFWIGVVALGFAALYWFEAGKIRISPLDDPVTAAGLPKALGVALGVLAMVMIVRSVLERVILSRAPARETAARPPLAERMRPHLRAAGVLGLGVGYLLVVPHIGYTLAIIALIMAVSLYIGASFGFRFVAVAVLGGAFFYLLFVELLGIPLPPGALIEMILDVYF